MNRPSIVRLLPSIWPLEGLRRSLEVHLRSLEVHLRSLEVHLRSLEVRAVYQHVSATRWGNAIYVRLDAGPTPVKVVYRLQIKAGGKVYMQAFPRPARAGARREGSSRFDVPNAAAIHSIDVIVHADAKTLAKETEDMPAWGEDIASLKT